MTKKGKKVVWWAVGIVLTPVVLCAGLYLFIYLGFYMQKYPGLRGVYTESYEEVREIIGERDVFFPDLRGRGWELHYQVMMDGYFFWAKPVSVEIDIDVDHGDYRNQYMFIKKRLETDKEPTDHLGVPLIRLSDRYQIKLGDDWYEVCFNGAERDEITDTIIRQYLESTGQS